jgi:hypothetical protein
MVNDIWAPALRPLQGRMRVGGGTVSSTQVGEADFAPSPP